MPDGKAIAKTTSTKGRAGRIVSSAVAIAWSVALLIFFNFFNQYIAFYHLEGAGGTSVWVRESLLNGDFVLWLPIIDVVLIFAILGHVMLIAIDKYVLREATLLVLDIFSIIALASLLSIFPFDFSPVPNEAVADALPFAVGITLGIVVFAIGIGVIVRLVKLIVNLIRGTFEY
jgi:hypothetical protein